MIHTVYSLAISALAGILYSIIFFLQQKNVRKNIPLSILLSLTRHILCALLLYYLLRSLHTSPILVLVSFILAFWIMAFIQKSKHYERT